MEPRAAGRSSLVLLAIIGVVYGASAFWNAGPRSNLAGRAVPTLDASRNASFEVSDFGFDDAGAVRSASISGRGDPFETEHGVVRDGAGEMEVMSQGEAAGVPLPMPRIDRLDRASTRNASARTRRHRIEHEMQGPRWLFDDVRGHTLRPAGPGHVLPPASAQRGRSIRMADDAGEIQMKLKRLGYYDGAITGRFDVPTQRAILLFQIDEGLPRTGRVNAALVEHLQEAARSRQLANAGR